VNGSNSKALKICGVICGTVVLLALWIAVRWDAPPLRIVRDQSKIGVDVSTFGEYATTITRIRLSDLSGRQVVWELRADTDNAQIRGFTLREGENPTRIDNEYGTYSVLAPQDSPVFFLHTGAKYKVELWGGSSVFSKKSTVFRVGG